MSVIDHTIIQRYKIWEGGESRPRGKGFILNQQRLEESPEMQEQQDDPTAESPSNFDTSIQALHRRLDRQKRRMNRQFDALAYRQDTMITFNTQFATTLSEIFSVTSDSQVQFPVYYDIPAYLPQDSPDDVGDEESHSSDDQGSPVF